MVSFLTPPTSHLEPQDTQKLALIRHTCAHIMAMAVQKLYPGTKVAIGPVTETGFFYDFDSPITLIDGQKSVRIIVKADE